VIEFIGVLSPLATFVPIAIGTSMLSVISCAATPNTRSAAPSSASSSPQAATPANKPDTTMTPANTNRRRPRPSARSRMP